MDIKAPNPNFKDYVALKISRNEYMKLIGFDIYNIQAGAIEGKLLFQQKHEQQNGFLHGAVTSALCDMACGFAAYTLVKEGEQVFTAEIKVTYLRPGTENEIFAKGWVIKPGKNIHFCEAEVFQIVNKEIKLIAKASSTMAIVNNPNFSDKYIKL